MEIEKKIEKEFKKPFNEDEIEWRVQQIIESKGETYALMLPYVEARAIMDRLDNVVGIYGWSDKYTEHKNGIKCEITLRLENSTKSITKEDGADETNIEATKGGISNSFKRCAVKFGIGRYLYKFENQFLALSKKEFEVIDRNGKKTFKKLTQEGRKKLDNYHLNNKPKTND